MMVKGQQLRHIDLMRPGHRRGQWHPLAIGYHVVFTTRLATSVEVQSWGRIKALLLGGPLVAATRGEGMWLQECICIGSSQRTLPRPAISQIASSRLARSA